jgi:vitamin B12 transporter
LPAGTLARVTFSVVFFIMFSLNSVRLAPGVRSAVAVACGFALLSSAQLVWSADAGLDPVVVTATRAPVPLSQLVGDVTVVSRQDIERSVASDLLDLLRQQPGIEMARNGGPGGSSSVFTRGADNRFTALLIDGVRVDAQSGDGGAPWLNIPLSQIERIEILRGPASAVYGSDAVAGVVQVFTRQGNAKPTVELGGGLGSNGTTQADALISGKEGAVDYMVAMNTDRSNGTGSVVNPASSYYNADRDGYRSHSAQGRLGWQINPEHRLELRALGSEVDAQYDAYGSTRDDHSLSKLSTVNAVWSAKWLNQWRSQLIVSEATQKYETSPTVYGTETRSRVLTFQNDVQLGIHGLHITGETRRDDLENSGLTQSLTVGSADRTIDGLALGYDLRKGGHALQVNARTDKDSEFGTHNTGSIAGGVQILEGLRLTASAATAFRAPTLYQRFSQYGFIGLQPESARNVEVGASYKTGDVSTSVAVYRNRISNLIDYDFGCSCYQNVGRAVLKGVTFQAGWTVSGVRLSGALDFLSARNEETKEQLVRRARRHASLKADTDLAGWDLGVQWLGSSSRADFDWDQYEPVSLHGYSAFNVMIGRTLSPDWKVQLKVDNAFQNDYQTAYGYGGTGRKALLTLRWTPSH